MKYSLVVLGIAILVIGIVGAAAASVVSGNATTRYLAECSFFNPSLECRDLFSTMTTYSLLTGISAILAGTGVLVLVIGIVLEVLKERPPLLGPSPFPSSVPPPVPGCPRCGRPLRHVPEYQRWFCDSCQWYA